MTFILSPEGGTQEFTTIGQANYWLRRKWPVTDHYRDLALERIDAAMHCLGSVGAARKAFFSAAITAGFKPDRFDAGTASAV